MLRRAARWLRRPPLTIRTRLTLTFAALFTMGGSVLVLALTTVFYRAIFRPLPASAVPSNLDPDHDHIIGLSDQIRDAAASHLLRVSLFLLLVVVGVSALLGWWIAGRMLRPIAAITAAARRATDTTLHERLNLPGPRTSSSSSATPSTRCWNAWTRPSAPSGALSPTPATSCAPAGADPGRGRGRPRQARRHRGAVAHHGPRRRRLDPARAAADRGPAHAGPLRAGGHRLRGGRPGRPGLRGAGPGRRPPPGPRSAAGGRPGPAALRGNVALLGIAVGNLLENAVKYNHDGGLLLVRTRQVDNHWVEVEVGNDGPVVPAEQIDQLFEPFHRGQRTRRHSQEPARDGVGLGLSIVRAVVRAHGGRVAAQGRPAGGLLVTLRLPVTP
ncbi:sensor histidine kinase [Streptacidiphilus sp. 4-A2]|nr:sensor histidine kinase [Streptacidiphilus sp. 4-A2]